MVTSPTHSRNSLGPVPVSSLFAVWLLLLFLAQTSVGWAQSPDARAFIADKYLSTDDHQLRLNIANRFDRQNLKDLFSNEILPASWIVEIYHIFCVQSICHNNLFLPIFSLSFRFFISFSILFDSGLSE